MRDLTKAAGRLAAGLFKGAAQVCARVRDSARSVITMLPRALGRLRGKIRPSLGLARSFFMATIGKDRGFGFWWLMAMAAVALIVGVLVTVLLSPVIGILAALAVAIWLLIRRSRSAQSSKGHAQPAS